MKVEFDKISDESRIWIYQSNNDFTESDVDIINKKFIGIVGSPYLFLKYNIDSLQLVRSNEYYIKNPKVMSKIYGKVLKRMEKSKDSIDNIKTKEN